MPYVSWWLAGTRLPSLQGQHSHPHQSTQKKESLQGCLEHAVSHLCTGSKVEMGNALRIIHAGVWIEHSWDLIARQPSKIQVRDATHLLQV